MTSAQSIAVSPIDGQPDWDVIDRQILCPLCNYNLRGLAEPRCPECGHAFEWEQRLNEGLRNHPWLFEHADRDRLRCFFVTLRTSLRSRRFWKSVEPIHQPSVPRMALYWLLVICLVIATRAISESEDRA